ncbi:MAG: carboxylesterase family protein [Phycisphaerae bacterium]|nr:carboxylesterase family protein [Saprospiraceae bacterium]
MKKNFLFLTAYLACFAALLPAQNPGCDGSRYLNNVFSTVKMTTVAYAPTVSHLGQNINLSMDVYEPQGDTLSSRPVVVLAHGGSFIFGDKSMMQQWCELLAKKGYVAVSIQYRLYPFLVLGLPDSIKIFDTAVKATGDMKAAVRFLREDAATANQFRVDASNIFIGGYSAGAVTALHTAYLGLNDQIPTFLQTLITANGGLEGISGTASNKTYSSHSDAIVNMSGGLYRSFWVDNTASPIVSIHGTADATVPYTYGLAANIAFLEGSSLVHARAESVGLWNNLLTVPGAGHTDLYEQAKWKPYIDTFWVNATTLLESLTCTTVGIDEPTSSVEPWSIFPNPSSGEGFNIQLPESEASSVDLSLLDLLGKVVFHQKSISNHQYVALNNLPKGIYVVQIVHPSKRFELKQLVIQ